jgi:uncharacterized membrane protein YoaK (UPF0700 family)
MLTFLTILAQAEDAAAGGAGSSIIGLLVAVLVIAGMWKVFTKAGKPGWAAIIPIYNIVVLLQIAGKPLWWIVLLFIPIVNIVVGVMVMIGIAKAFGKGTGFALGLLFLSPIFIPILGFSDAQYVGSPA